MGAKQVTPVTLVTRAAAWWRALLTYFAFVLVPAAVVVVITGSGVAEVSQARQPNLTTPASIPAEQALYKLMLAAAVIIAAAHVVGSLATKVGQPRVVGEMAAGFLLGPSILGAAFPGLSSTLFPPSLLPLLDTLAQLGVIFFMFLMGRELPLNLLRGSRSTALVVGHASVAVPFLFGVLLAQALPPSFRPAGIPETAFVLFCGIALSVTAFPVLARILQDRDLAETEVGAVGMATAGVGDVTAWCLLALVVTVVRGESAMDVLATIGLTLAFGAVMWWGVRPLLRYLTSRAKAKDGREQLGMMIMLLVVVLLAATATGLIGVHAIFGAFLAGVVMPRDTLAVDEFCFRLEGLTVWFLLPLFFATVGLKTRFDGLGSATGLLVLISVIVVAVAGKLLGTYFPGRAIGLDRRAAFGLSAMMNCRGLTEIVVLNIGLSLRVIPTNLFTVMVGMALLTTVMTSPVLAKFCSQRSTKPDAKGVKTQPVDHLGRQDPVTGDPVAAGQ